MDTKLSNYKINDENYLGQAVYGPPKEYFKKSLSHIKDHSKKSDKPISLVEVGCASGAFIHYIQSQLDLKQCCGIDISDQLIKQAKDNVVGAEFLVGSITNTDDLKLGEFDITVCLGTLCIFEDLEPLLKNLINLTKKNGKLIIFDFFNEDGIDVRMSFKIAKNEATSGWRTALNNHSMYSYEKLLEKINPGCTINWHDFKMPFSIKKTDDPMRTWTIKTEENENQVIVGTGQLLHQKFLVVTKR